MELCVFGNKFWGFALQCIFCLFYLTILNFAMEKSGVQLLSWLHTHLVDGLRKFIGVQKLLKDCWLFTKIREENYEAKIENF